MYGRALRRRLVRAASSGLAGDRAAGLLADPRAELRHASVDARVPGVGAPVAPADDALQELVAGEVAGAERANHGTAAVTLQGQTKAREVGIMRGKRGMKGYRERETREKSEIKEEKRARWKCEKRD